MYIPAGRYLLCSFRLNEYPTQELIDQTMAALAALSPELSAQFSEQPSEGHHILITAPIVFGPEFERHRKLCAQTKEALTSIIQCEGMMDTLGGGA